MKNGPNLQKFGPYLAQKMAYLRFENGQTQISGEWSFALAEKVPEKTLIQHSSSAFVMDRNLQSIF